MATDDIERLHYFQRQYLGADDLEAQQTYHRDMRRRHNVAHHTWGIVTGLQLQEQASLTDPKAVDVYILPGMAVDGFGREIVVFEPTQIPTTLFDGFTNLAHRRVWVEYTQNNTSFPQPGYGACERNDYSRIQESFVILAEVSSPAHDPVNLSGLPATPPAIPTDESVPEQEFPDDASGPQWPICLGHVHWDGTAQRFITAVPEKAVKGRRYIGVVCEQVIGPAGKLILRDRSAPDPLPTDQNATGYAGVAAEVEGTLQVDRLLTAKQNIEIDGGQLVFDNAKGGDDQVPLWMSRLAGPKTPGTADLRVHIGDAVIGDTNAADTRLTIGNLANDGSEAIILDVKGGNTVDIPTGALMFGSLPRQMLDLYTAFDGNAYHGIGVQPNTLYFRSPDSFAWYQAGLPAVGDLDPGSGGKLALTLNTGGLFFGKTTQQMLNLYETTYGIGVQNEAMYFRSDSDFCWFRGGTHIDTQDNPGSGDLVMFIDKKNRLWVNGVITCNDELDVHGALHVTQDANIDGDTTIGGNLRVSGDQNLVKVITHLFNLPNADLVTPQTWTYTHNNEFSKVYTRFAVMQGFSVFGPLGPSAIQFSQEFWVPQTVFVNVTGGDNDSTTGQCYCSNAGTGGPQPMPPVGGVQFMVVVIGKGIE